MPEVVEELKQPEELLVLDWLQQVETELLAKLVMVEMVEIVLWQERTVAVRQAVLLRVGSGEVVLEHRLAQIPVVEVAVVVLDIMVAVVAKAAQQEMQVAELAAVVEEVVMLLELEH